MVSLSEVMAWRLDSHLSDMTMDYNNSRHKFLEESKSLKDMIDKKLEAQKLVFWKRLFTIFKDNKKNKSDD